MHIYTTSHITKQTCSAKSSYHFLDKEGVLATCGIILVGRVAAHFDCTVLCLLAQRFHVCMSAHSDPFMIMYIHTNKFYIMHT